MTQHQMNDDGRGDRSLPPARMTLIGFAVTAIGALASFVTASSSEPGWLSVIGMGGMVAGLILAGLGVAERPRSVQGLLVAAAAAWAAYLGVHPAWDSPQLLFQVLGSVAAVAAIVLLLPRALRYAVVSGLAVFHFLGVLSAITSPPPQSWISLWAWTNVFRPHLVFCYTNNAYQFYSPEPGPACLLWFCIEGHDGQKVWYKLPRKPDSHLDPMAVQFYRRLSITESVNQNYTLANVPPQNYARRLQSLQQFPFHPEVPQAAQFRLPQDNVRRSVASYVRYLTGVYGGPDKVKSIRLYRVMHRMLEVNEFAAGENPYAKWTYLPYFMGEYDTEGNLKDPYDPTLFWMIPIIKKPVLMTAITRPGGGPVEVENYLARHAGSDPFEE